MNPKQRAVLAIAGLIAAVWAVMDLNSWEPPHPAPVAQAQAAPPQRDMPSAEQLEAFERGAMAGDYQAQRNHAWALSTAGPVFEQNPVLSCAWRVVILQSGSPQVDESDAQNAKLACGQLDQAARVAAEAQARVLYDRVYVKRRGY